MNTVRSLTLVAALLGANLALAESKIQADAPQSRHETSTEHFVRIDSDRDGVISQSEFSDANQGDESAEFELVDSNSDGLLAKSEWANHRDHDQDGDHD